MIENYIYFMCSILIHEISHIIVSKALKINLKNLRVSIFGASLEIEKNTKYRPIKRIFVYIAGPFSNIILAITFIFLNKRIEFAYTNILIAIFNLLPIIPLDGANILKEILKINNDIVKSNKIVLIISKIFLSIIAFLYSLFIFKIKNIYIVILICYLLYLNSIEEKKIYNLERVYKILKKNLISNKEKILQ